jgi:signal transduction histidine kinase
MSDDIHGNKISLEMQLGNDLPVITADAVQISQVIANLLRNAIEAVAAMEECRRKIRLRSRRDGNSVAVEVQDQGVGIPEVEKIFEPFVTTKTTGMGMGLAICRSIVEAHAGNIWGASNFDAGATFSFILPIGNSGRVQQGRIASPSDAESACATR